MSDAFITGSRAYGTPRPDSDIDLVIRCSPADAEILLKYDEAPDGELLAEGYYDEGILQVRYGRLNLILCVNDARYEEWVELTELARPMAPVSRAVARAMRESLREC